MILLFHDSPTQKHRKETAQISACVNKYNIRSVSRPTARPSLQIQGQRNRSASIGRNRRRRGMPGSHRPCSNDWCPVASILWDTLPPIQHDEKSIGHRRQLQRFCMQTVNFDWEFWQHRAQPRPDLRQRSYGQEKLRAFLM